MQRDSLATRLLGVERKLRRYQQEGMPPANNAQPLPAIKAAPLLQRGHYSRG